MFSANSVACALCLGGRNAIPSAVATLLWIPYTLKAVGGGNPPSKCHEDGRRVDRAK